MYFFNEFLEFRNLRIGTQAIQGFGIGKNG